MIKYIDSAKMFCIETKNTSYVFRLLDAYKIEHIYYGKKLSGFEGIEYHNCGLRHGFSSVDAVSEGEYSSNDINSEYPYFGSTDMGKPAFHAQYADGSRITVPEYVSHRIYDGKTEIEELPSLYANSENDAKSLEITTKDSRTGLTFVHTYTVFGDSDAIVKSVKIVNGGNDSADIKSAMSVCFDIDDNGYDFVHLFGAWARERHIERKPVVRGTMKIESRRGSSSHMHSPFFALAAGNADESNGEVYGFSLLYSGNFEAGIEKDTYNKIRIFMGINSFDFGWQLKPGESFNTPEAVMVYSPCGFNGMSANFHSLYRNHLARKEYRYSERPILINNWEATYFDFNEEKILQIAKIAKETGIELMVLDDGWFGKRDKENSSLGDWYPDKRKLPDGIIGLSEKVNALGMKFGLWFEPEMVSPDSDLYRAHPDWCLHVEGRGRSLGRNQLVLDLSRRDVCDFIIGFLTDILSSANISYIKWDMNRNMTEVGSALLPAENQTEVSHRYMLGLYRILDTVTKRFPDILFEGCSGGGGRFDAGMMRYFDQYWTSDDTDAVERLYIQYGTSLVMPSSFMGAHVAAVPNHQIGRTTPLKMRGDVAFGGQLGYELDITKMSKDELLEVGKQIEFYKEIREIVHDGTMYRLVSPFETNETAWEYIAEDGKSVVLCYYVIKADMQKDGRFVKLSGLDKDTLYRVRGTEKVYNGSVLENYGIQLEGNTDYYSEVVVLDKI